MFDLFVFILYTYKFDVLAALLCLFWNIWRARNRLVFENEVPNAQRTKASFVTNLWSWANLHSADYTHSAVDFLTWLGSR